jgi:peptidoglycan biosynthesis protein MviN/MurJ (putative lipid II flippase)
MAKLLEIIGLVLVAIMSLGFVGAFKPYGIEPGLSILFWICAVGALMIIIYRKKKRKQQEEKEN